MSLFAKIVFGSACIGTGIVIGYVHLSQYMDRQSLHEGILKDLERQEQYETLQQSNKTATTGTTSPKEFATGRWLSQTAEQSSS